MSLKRNVIANYSSQVYVMLISIITLPFLIKHIGVESYGLVGFFMLLQNWLMLLDLGISPTLTREISRFRGGVLDANNLLHLFHFLKKIFIWIAISFATIICFSSKIISDKWLKIEQLDESSVVYSIILIGLILAVRWVTGIYKSVITGFEKMVWLSLFNSTFATFRYVIVFVVIVFVNASPVYFFAYQLLVSMLEFIWVLFYVKRILPAKDVGGQFTIRPLKEIMGFSLTVAFTSAVWVIVTQTDKLILSNLMTLSDYGYYSLAVQLAAGITFVSTPLSAVILPRMAKLEAEGKHDEMIGLYRAATEVIVVICGSVSIMLIFFAKKILMLWTGGDIILTNKVYPFLILYAIGNMFQALAAFPFYLQYAKGNLKFHLFGNITFVVLLIPTLLYMVIHYGGLGAGYTWIFVNAFYFFTWIPFIHNYFEKGLNAKWYVFDIALVILPILAITYLLSLLEFQSDSKFEMFLFLSVVGMVILVVGSLASAKIRKLMLTTATKIYSKYIS